jgi:hypothetical protein
LCKEKLKPFCLGHLYFFDFLDDVCKMKSG